MRCLNEYIARLANKEDGCTGRFWEGRFKSQALLDEQALVTAMAYVDLNPVRAGLADSIGKAEYTSGQQRLHEITAPAVTSTGDVKPALCPFAQELRRGHSAGLPFSVQDYLELLDTSGRVIHPHKHGAIPDATPRLLESLGLAAGEWLQSVVKLQARFRLFIGAPHRLSALAKQRGWRWIRGQSAARKLYGRDNE